MGLRACPRCGATYLGTVAACADCRVVLVDTDEAGVVAAGNGSASDGAVTADAVPDGVGYDLSDWSEEQRVELSSALVAEGVTYAWDGDELVVPEPQADAVEGLIDDIDHPDALDAAHDDGDDTGAQLLSDLYVASDVLAGDPDNRAAVTELLEAAGRVHTTTPPFGVPPATWDALGVRVDELARALGDDADEEAVVASARAVRDLLRPLV